MDIAEARAIVRTLAKGIDPVTGELFAADSPYNQPQVIRALFAVHDACLRGRGPVRSPDERRQNNIASGRPRNAGLPWSDDDRERVAAGFKAGTPLPELAHAVERTEYAIHSELIRQGLLEPTADFPRRAS